VGIKEADFKLIFCFIFDIPVHDVRRQQGTVKKTSFHIQNVTVRSYSKIQISCGGWGGATSPTIFSNLTKFYSGKGNFSWVDAPSLRALAPGFGGEIAPLWPKNKALSPKARAHEPNHKHYKKLLGVGLEVLTASQESINHPSHELAAWFQ